MTTTLDLTYAVQDGCWNCANLFERWGVVGEDTFDLLLYCTADNPPGPPSAGETEEVWHEWAEGREVQPAGKCRLWELRKEEKS